MFFRLILLLLIGYGGFNFSKHLFAQAESFASLRQTAFPNVELRLAGYWGDTPILGSLMNLGYQPSVNAKLCLKSVRLQNALGCGWIEPLKGYTSSTLRRGEFNLNGKSISLGNIRIPAGVYNAVEIELDSSCSGLSASLSNFRGKFATRSDLRLKFYGEFFVRQEEQVFSLSTQRLIDSLSNVASSRQIKQVTEETIGGF